MSVILRPDGMLAKPTIVGMSARQVTWFIDPEATLQHLNDLQSLRLAAYCQNCYQNGLDDVVTASFNPETRAWTVHCSCADYSVIHDRGARGLDTTKTEDDGTVKTIRILSTDELLFRLGWSFRCAGDCAVKGLHDGVRGDNDPSSGTVKVICGCTERIYQQAGGAA